MRKLSLTMHQRGWSGGFDARQERSWRPAACLIAQSAPLAGYRRQYANGRLLARTSPQQHTPRWSGAGIRKQNCGSEPSSETHFVGSGWNSEGSAASKFLPNAEEPPPSFKVPVRVGS